MRVSHRKGVRFAADMTGQRFGRLVVTGRAPNSDKPGDRVPRWHCRCDCGTDRVVRATLLRNGATRSCGCLMRERAATVNRSHGQSARGWTAEYRAWASMIQRCTNPKQRSYPYYGGRGITIHPEWRESFPAFFRDVGPIPESGGPWSLDRIDPDGNYAPGNVRWATRETQMNNMRKSRTLTHDGRTLTIAQWARATGLTVGTITRRVKLGWTACRTLTESPKRPGQTPPRSNQEASNAL